jgi:tungstate transport system substrate-binding protein
VARRQGGAYSIVERGVWDAAGGAPLAVLVEGDPLLAIGVHAMRSFRVSHPAGKIFLNWLAGPKGRHVVAAQRGYLAP